MSEIEHDLVLGNLVRAVHVLEACPDFAAIVPEVRVNLAYALPGATGRMQVAAVEGRITRVGDRPRASGLPAFGASDHMARLLVETLRREPGLRAGINFAWSEELLAHLKSTGYDPVRIDRTREPPEVAGPDRASMPWKIGKLVEAAGRVPRLFFESEGMGKEPLFVLLGPDAVAVAEEACRIARSFAASA
jgi:hydroxymethylpyrimidine/phosphomethylpyrimidine kinase